jgi:hypothetical protein
MISYLLYVKRTHPYVAGANTVNIASNTINILGPNT